jgi:hypothetical protein
LLQHTKREKIYQMAVNRPNRHKTYQHRPLHTRLCNTYMYTHIGIFGLKI